MTGGGACWMLFVCLSSFAFSGSATETDSVPSAITVYRNPEFFRNLTRGKEKEDSDEEADKEGFNSSDSEEFHDFEDEYRYPGEPKKPNAPATPDFTTYYDESPEFIPEPRDVSPSSKYEEEEDGEEGVENEEQEEEREPESSKYHVPLEKDLQLEIRPKLYEESRQYYNPFFKTGMESFSYPSSYEDLDYYPKPYANEKLTDNKKGTREYLRDHSPEELEEETQRPSRADSKHVFRTATKFGFKAYAPVLYAPHAYPKIKYKVLYRPKKLRGIREIPDDSAYQLSSDYDSDFEFV